MSLLIRNARVLLAFTKPPAAPLRGAAMGRWPILDRADVLIEGERIASVGDSALWELHPDTVVIEAAGRVLQPAFVDCHTHACWAGDRLEEWELRRAGTPYLEILKRGGGIMSTVRAVRAATDRELSDLLGARLHRMLRLGSGTIEVKSGYGLSTRDELRMLRAIANAAGSFPGTVVPTALLGHAIDADAASPAQFIEHTLSTTLPAVHAEFPGIAIDAYCEQGAWSLEDCRRLFDLARALGHPIRIHADQFNSLGVIALNSEWSRGGGADTCFRSIDHLEATGRESLAELAATATIGVLLPCTGFHTDGRYADGRTFIDAGGAAALATNANPGTSPTFSMPMAIALAVRFNRLSVTEAIAAATVNAAAVLGMSDRGIVTPGSCADLMLLTGTDERLLAYEFGDSQIATLIIGGRLVDSFR